MFLKKIFLLITLVLFSYAGTNLQGTKTDWYTASAICKNSNKRLPILQELDFLKKIFLHDGPYWSSTATDIPEKNYRYWVIVKKGDHFKKGYLSKSQKAHFICIKGKKKGDDIIRISEARDKFRMIFKSDVIQFKKKHFVFVGEPMNMIDQNVYPYNFYQFKIRFSKKMKLKVLKALEGRVISFENVLLGKVANVRRSEGDLKTFYILTVPVKNPLKYYYLPDDSIIEDD